MSLAGISAAQVPRSRGWKESSERGGRLAGALRATVSRERERKYSYALFCCCTLLFSILALHDHHNNSNSHARPRPASRVPLRSLIHLTSPRSESRKPSPQEIHVPHQKSPLTCEREREREREPIGGLRELSKHRPTVAEQYQHCTTPSSKKQPPYKHVRAQRILHTPGEPPKP